MGVSKAGGRDEITPKREFLRRRSLSDLAVWGFPETFPENLPPQALLSPPQPCFLPLDHLLQFLHPSKPSLHLSRSGLFTLSTSLTHFFPSSTPSTSLSPILGPYQTPSEHLRNPSMGSPKGPKTALFRPF